MQSDSRSLEYIFVAFVAQQQSRQSLESVRMSECVNTVQGKDVADKTWHHTLLAEPITQRALDPKRAQRGC